MLGRSHALLVLAFLLPAGFMVLSCAPPPPAESLETGRKVTRPMWRNHARFVFSGRAGEVITLRVNSKSPGLDPQVSLLDPMHRVEAFDDDGGEHGNCFLANHTLKRTGQYTVLVRSDGNVRGEVEVLLEKAKPPAH